MTELHALYQSIVEKIVDSDQRDLMPDREDRLKTLMDHIEEKHQSDLERAADETDTMQPGQDVTDSIDKSDTLG